VSEGGSDGSGVFRRAPRIDDAELERMDDLELIARVTSHIPDQGQVMVRFGILTSGRGRDILLFVREGLTGSSGTRDFSPSAKMGILSLRPCP